MEKQAGKSQMVERTLHPSAATVKDVSINHRRAHVRVVYFNNKIELH